MMPRRERRTRGALAYFLATLVAVLRGLAATVLPLAGVLAIVVLPRVLAVLVLLRAERLSSLWRDMRGQLLLVVAAMAGSYFAVRQLLPEAELWLMFSYLVMAFCGLLLVLQPVPGSAGTKLHASRKGRGHAA